MFYHKAALLMSILLPLIGASPILAEQKGLGDTLGMAQADEKPTVTTISGELTEVKVGPCEHTTGKADTGVHLILQTEEGKTINLHLGPNDAMKDVRDQVSIGQTVEAEVFRTEKMPSDAYVAKNLRLGESVISLRDDDLRPFWAEPRNGNQNRKGKKRQKSKG